MENFRPAPSAAAGKSETHHMTSKLSTTRRFFSSKDFSSSRDISSSSRNISSSSSDSSSSSSSDISSISRFFSSRDISRSSRDISSSSSDSSSSSSRDISRSSRDISRFFSSRFSSSRDISRSSRDISRSSRDISSSSRFSSSSRDISSSSRFSSSSRDISSSRQPTEPDVPTVKRSSSLEWLPPDMSELRVVLLGNSWSQRSSVGNFILGENKFNPEVEPLDYRRVRSAVLNEKRIVLINTPDLLSTASNATSLWRCLTGCTTASDPGPHVFLLVLQPEDFTEEHYMKLNMFLKLFSNRSLNHSLVLISTPREESPGFMETYRQQPPLKNMIKDCQYRYLWQKDLELPELLTRLGQVVKENNGKHSENLPTEALSDLLF